MKMRTSGRKTIIGTVGAVLLLAAALFPLSLKMDAGRVISTSDDMQRRITLMHVNQALRMERDAGSAAAPGHQGGAHHRGRAGGQHEG